MSVLVLVELRSGMPTTLLLEVEYGLKNGIASGPGVASGLGASSHG